MRGKTIIKTYRRFIRFDKARRIENVSVMEKSLSKFSVGERGIIAKVLGEGRIRRRLFDMGITPQTEVYLRKKAPLGDPIEITLRGYELSLRKSEADLIIVGNAKI